MATSFGNRLSLFKEKNKKHLGCELAVNCFSEEPEERKQLV